MPQAVDSLDEIWPSPPSRGPTSSMTETQPDTQPTTLDEGEVSPPQFDRVAEVLGPLEQVVLAADQKLGSIQQQVSVQAGEESAHVERRVREAAVAQRQRIGDLRQELTGRRSELSARFDAILQLLEEVDRDLALRAGEGGADVRVTLTERQRVEVSHEIPPAIDLTAAPAAGPPSTAPAAAATPSKPPKERGFARWFRRSKRESA